MKKSILMLVLVSLCFSVFAASNALPDLQEAIKCNSDGKIITLFGVPIGSSVEEVIELIKPHTSFFKGGFGKHYTTNTVPQESFFFDEYDFTVSSFWSFRGDMFCKKSYPQKDDQWKSDYNKLSKMINGVLGVPYAEDFSDSSYRRNWSTGYDNNDIIVILQSETTSNGTFIYLLFENLLNAFVYEADLVYLSSAFGIPAEEKNLLSNQYTYLLLGEDKASGQTRYYVVPLLPDVRFIGYAPFYQEGNLYVLYCETAPFSNDSELLDCFNSIKEDLDKFASMHGYDSFNASSLYEAATSKPGSISVINAVSNGGDFSIDYGIDISGLSENDTIQINVPFFSITLQIYSNAANEVSIHMFFIGAIPSNMD